MTHLNQVSRTMIQEQNQQQQQQQGQLQHQHQQDDGMDVDNEPSLFNGNGVQGPGIAEGGLLSLLHTSTSSLWGLPGGSGGYMDFVFRSVKCTYTCEHGLN